MDENTEIDFEGPGGPEHGGGLDSTANTARVLGDDLRVAYEAIEGGEASPEVEIADEKLAGFTRSLRDRPEVARYLGQKTATHGDDRTPPGDVDDLLSTLVEIGLESAAPEFATLVDEEFEATRDD